MCDGCGGRPVFRADVGDGTVLLCDGCRSIVRSVLTRDEPRAARWSEKADENVEEWGKQSVDTLLLAAQEELGELTQAHLEARAEDGDPDRVGRELDDLGALLFQLARVLDDVETAE